MQLHHALISLVSVVAVFSVGPVKAADPPPANPARPSHLIFLVDHSESMSKLEDTTQALANHAVKLGELSGAPIKIAFIYGTTGPFEAYARQTEAGFMLGLEYATKGTMEIGGRKIQVILKDDQLKPDLAKAALEQAYGDDKVDIAVGTTGSAGALAMLPIAEEYKKLLVVEPAVADQITGEKWNRYIFRTERNST